MKNPFEVLGNSAQIYLQIAADSISKACKSFMVGCSPTGVGVL